MNEITRINGPVLQPQSFGELVEFAKLACTSDLMPKDYKDKPANIMLAVQMGSELGLSPMQSIQNISVINGRPAVWGDAMLGLVRRDPRCQDVVETLSGAGEAMEAICVVQRRGATPVEGRFSVADAKKAGLWSKQGPWQQYPQRMLQLRARGFALRDAFPDVLKGLLSAEEARDTPPGPPFAGTTIEAKAEAPVPPRQPTPAQPKAAAPRQPTTAEYLGDDLPDWSAAEYPFATAKGGMIYRSSAEWLERWRRLIEACALTGAPDKLKLAAEMNEAQIAAVAGHDAEAARELREALETALSPAAQADPETAAAEPEPEMALP